MKNFTWKIASVDTTMAHMVVDYAYDNEIHSLNIPIPPATEDREDWIKMYAPVQQWSRTASDLHTFEVGNEGSGEFELIEIQSTGEQPNVLGNWNEEYLRAMIYQVMEEIRESEV